MPSLRRREVAILVLRLCALVVAGYAQMQVETRSWWCLAGLLCGGLLFLVAERLAPVPAEPAEAAVPSPTPRVFWFLFAAGCVLCGLAAIYVYRGAGPERTHPPWLLGMLLLVAAAVWPAWRSRHREGPSRQVVAGAVLLTLIATVVFTWHLTAIPPEVHGDEAEVGLDAARLLQNRPLNLFTIGWYELPILHASPGAIGLKIFGINLLGLRAANAALGVISVLLLFAFAARLWGFEVGVIAALLLTSQCFFIHLSRTGYHYVQTPFVSILVAFLFARAWYDLSLSAAICCGIVLGLGIQGYYATRLVPVLVALTWVLWLVGDPRMRRVRFGRFVVVVLTAVAVAAPMIAFFSHHWDALWARTRGTSVFTPESIRHLSHSYGTEDLLTILRIQSVKAFTLFNLTGDTSLQYGFGAHGLLEPVSAVLFVLGFAALWARPLRRRNLLFIVWIVTPVVAGAALTIDTPFFPRAGGMLPFALVAVALALHSLQQSARAVLPGTVGRVVAGVVTAGVVALVFANGLRDYFVVYAPHHRHGPAVEISAFIVAHGAGKTTYMVGARGYSVRHGSIRFLAYGYATDDISDLDLFLQRNRLDPQKSVFVIMPQGRDLVPKLEAAVGSLVVEPHHNLHNNIDFYTAVPVAAQPR